MVVLCLLTAILLNAARDGGPGPDQATETPFPWIENLGAAREQSSATGTPVVVCIDTPDRGWERYIEAAVPPGSRTAQAASGFIWVHPDPNHRFELVSRFNVDAYPTLLVLGPNEENVHRRSGFLASRQLAEFLEEGRHRYELFLDGQEWDALPPRPGRVSDRYEFETMPAPSQLQPSGLAIIGNVLFVKQGSTVFRLDGSTGEVLGSFELPLLVTDLCAEGGLLYGIDYGWTSGRPIYVIDPADGEIVRTIVTEANLERKEWAAYGIACRGDRFWVLELPSKIQVVDPWTGIIERTLDTPDLQLTGLDFDGEHLVSLTRRGVVFLDPRSGGLDRMVPMNYPLRSIAFHDGRYVLMEQPVEGFDRANQPVRISPSTMLIYSVSLEPSVRSR